MSDAAKLVVQLSPAPGELPSVKYRWDEDTDILIATLQAPPGGEGLSGTIEVQGDDGSWLNFDVADGRIRAVEIAIWPEVRKMPRLTAPSGAEPGTITVPARQRTGRGVAAIEVDTSLIAETDDAERTYHFAMGAARQALTVRIARELLLDLDSRSRIAGVWLLDVPPSPEHT